MHIARIKVNSSTFSLPPPLNFFNKPLSSFHVSSIHMYIYPHTKSPTQYMLKKTPLQIMSDKPTPKSQWLQASTFSQSQLMRLTMAGVLGGSLLGLAGMSLTATLIGLMAAAPPLLLLTLILVPAMAVLSLITSGFIFSGTCLLGALGVTVCMYRYMTGKRPFGLEYYEGMKKIVSKGDVKDRGEKTRVETVQGS